MGIYEACPLALDQTLFPPPNNTDPLNSKTYLGGRDIQFYHLHSNIGVIYIPTFDPSGGKGTACSIRWILDAVQGIRNLTGLGVERVLIDTSNNGGGWIKLGQMLQRLLTGRQYLDQLNFESVFRKSQLAEKMMDAYVHQVKSADVAPVVLVTSCWSTHVHICPLSVSASAENHLRGSETGPCDRAPRVLSRSCASR